MRFIASLHSLRRTVVAMAEGYVPGTHSVAFVTVPNLEVGKQIAHGAVERKLASSVNIIPSVTSVYYWQGKVEEKSELFMIQFVAIVAGSRSNTNQNEPVTGVAITNTEKPETGLRNCMEIIYANQVVKTSTENVPDLTKFVREKHPYVCPQVIGMKIDGGNPDYLKWISETVLGQKTDTSLNDNK